MAESTLSLSYTELIDIVGQSLHGKDYTDLTDDQKAAIDSAINAGYRQFLYPPAVEGIDAMYSWTFLKVATTLTTIAPYETGTVGVSSGTCTLTAGVWPSWSATHGILTIDGTEYTVSSRDSDTVLTVVGDDVTAGEDTWDISHTGDYDLPDDFGSLIDGFSFARNEQYVDVHAGHSEGKIRSLRSIAYETNTPRVAAIRKKAGTMTDGQRNEVMFYPTPETAYVLGYRYEAYVVKLDSTNKYPLGGMKHSETFKLSCLAAADALINDNKGVHWDNFLMQLASSIKKDMNEQTQYFGNVGSLNSSSREVLTTNYTLTVNNERIYP